MKGMEILYGMHVGKYEEIMRKETEEVQEEMMRKKKLMICNTNSKLTQA